MLYVGIDLGTSAVKLLLMDSQGEVKNVVSREYPISFPHNGWSEQNPEDWYRETMLGLEELISSVSKDEVAGISFSGQMHGLVTLDDKDQVIRPAILWNDGRTVEETNYLNEVIGKEVLNQETGNIAFSGFTAPKILWMKKNEPELFERICKIMLPKDYLIYRMTGVFASDYSDAAGTLLLDVKNKKWSDKMLEICHITNLMVPKLFESSEKVGVLKKELADKLSLTSNVSIIAGAADNAAAAVGTGTVGNGNCNISLGTSGTLLVSNSGFYMDRALHSFAGADGGYYLMGCMLSAASCNKWWMDSILQTSEYSKEQDQIGELGENNVFFLPYLMGERSPHNDPKVRAMFCGMSMDTTRAEMTQAVLEGVAFALADMMKIIRNMGITVERTKICGGGAKSKLWRVLVANILNVTVETMEKEEGPAFGAAILAAVGCGEFDSVSSATEKLVRVKDIETPNRELVEKYMIKHKQFEQLYPAIRGLF